MVSSGPISARKSNASPTKRDDDREMTAPDDAFGHALLDVMSGGSGAHVIERDDGLVEPFPSAEPYFGDPGAFASIESSALGFLHGRVLDIGAGAGRFALEAQSRGHEVTALDDSAGAAQVCRDRGVDQVVNASFHLYEPDARFDTFLMMGNNLGLLAPDPVRSLDRIRAMAPPGARIVGTTRDPYATDDSAHLAYHEMNRARGRRPGHVVMRVRRRQLIGPWFDYLFCSEAELADIASKAGWSVTVVERDEVRYLAVLTM